VTEKQWLKSANAETMADYYDARFTERKARLYMLACCRRHPEHITSAAVANMVKLLAAHYADLRKPDKPFDSPAIRKAYTALETYASSTQDSATRGLAFGVVAAAEPVSVMKRLNEAFPYLVFSCIHDVAVGVSPNRENTKAESKVQAALLREVLGNSFQPVTPEPAWLTDTVLALARQIHESEDFTTMPILADALQDAGCENEAVLSHCRADEVTHVRGCWVLDSLLGKA